VTWEIATLLGSAMALVLAASRLSGRSRRIALVLGTLAVVTTGLGLLLR
jgi:hypothetical protein